MRFLIVMMMFAITAGCATKEKIEVQNQCQITAEKKYPPMFEQRTVQRVRPVNVPNGNVSCSTTGMGTFLSTNCTSGTNVEFIPYTSVERIDVNKEMRMSDIGSCVRSNCYRKYGNTDCQVSRSKETSSSSIQEIIGTTKIPNMECQSSKECPAHLSCRSRKGGGTECR